MASYYEIVTPPSAPAVSLAEAKAFMRVENDADDAVIEAMIYAATDSAELYTGRVFAPTVFRISQAGGSSFRILRAPVTSFAGAQSWNGTEFVNISGALYMPSSSFPTVSIPNYISAPTGVAFGLQATFTAGYDVLPPALKQGLLMHINYLYENRGDVEAADKVDLPTATRLLYRQYRIIATYGASHC